MISIKRLFQSFRYAVKGMIKTLKEEQNLHIQSMAAIFVVALGVYFGLTRMEWVALILVIGLVIIMEVVNSAIERVTDMLKPRLNTYVKEIKDIMAAAVMLASIMAVLVGVIIFMPYFSSMYR